MAKEKTVKNPVLIAKRVERTTGKDGDRKVTSYEPHVICAASEAPKVVKDLNAKLAPPKADSKTSREFMVMPSTGDENHVIPVIENAGDYALQVERENKRKALKVMPDDVRAALGLPAADADDDIIDAWTPAASAAAAAK